MDPAHRLARRVSRAAARRGALRTLLLDVDGTLAPIAPTPDQAEVPARTIEALRALVSSGWTVALVSGRPSREVRSMVPIAGIKTFGSHGSEGSWSGRSAAATPPSLRRRLARLARDAEALATSVPGVLVERKPAGLALHDRRVATSHRAKWHRELRAWLGEIDLDGLELLHGRRVVEIRPVGVHKGRVAETMPRSPRAGRRDESLVAMGDDVTDEDLFRAVGESGLSVRVGRPGKRTRAALRLASPTAVSRFLLSLVRETGAAVRR